MLTNALLGITLLLFAVYMAMTLLDKVQVKWGRSTQMSKIEDRHEALRKQRREMLVTLLLTQATLLLGIVQR